MTHFSRQVPLVFPADLAAARVGFMVVKCRLRVGSIQEGRGTAALGHVSGPHREDTGRAQCISRLRRKLEEMNMSKGRSPA